MSNTYVGVHLDDAYLATENGDPTVCLSSNGIVAAVRLGEVTVYAGEGASPGDLSAYLRRVADQLDATYVKWVEREQVSA